MIFLNTMQEVCHLGQFSYEVIIIRFKFDILQRHLKQQSLHKAAPEIIIKKTPCIKLNTFFQTNNTVIEKLAT